MFYGGDSHAESAAAIFSLIASCRLHGVDPQLYLDEVMRLLPYSPKERYLELAPKYWRGTRADLNPVALTDVASWRSADSEIRRCRQELRSAIARRGGVAHSSPTSRHQFQGLRHRWPELPAMSN
jgi:hypothetical protein